MHVYRFIENGEIVYVGKSVDYLNRWKSHDKLKEHFITEVAKCTSMTDMDIYELYYINKYNPKLNVASKHNIGFSIELPELEFKKIERKKSKEKLITKKDYKNPVKKNNYKEIIKDNTKDEMREYIEYDKKYLMYRMTKSQRDVHMFLLFFESKSSFVLIRNRTFEEFNINIDDADRCMDFLYLYNLIDFRTITYNDQNELELWTNIIKKDNDVKIKITKDEFVKILNTSHTELPFIL